VSHVASQTLFTALTQLAAQLGVVAVGTLGRSQKAIVLLVLVVAVLTPYQRASDCRRRARV
jgi:hypothetical protein